VETVATVLGWLVIVTACVVAVVWSLSAAAETLRRTESSRQELVRMDERRRVGKRLFDNSWWLTEDPGAAAALAAAGDLLCMEDSLDPDRCRENWRALVKKRAADRVLDKFEVESG
jgi:hypothetical protein